MSLRPNAVPSLFLWTRTSPRKHKAPTPRELESGKERSSTISDNSTSEENIMDVSDDDSTNDTSEETHGGEGHLTHEQVLKTPPRKTPQKDHDLTESEE